MEFTVEFYETNAGRSPVQEFLDALKASNPDDFVVVLAGLAKLRNQQYHREPLPGRSATACLNYATLAIEHARAVVLHERRRIVAVHVISQ
jgi:hypothetical protein